MTPEETARAARNVMQTTAYHFDQGPVVMYTVDAKNAVQSHPDEWSATPWRPEDAAKARAARDERRKEEVEQHRVATEEAKAAGVALPRPLAPLPPAPPEPTDRQKAEIDADTKARAEAAERVRVQTEKDEKLRVENEQIAADKALLASPPPQVDPNERRPFGRPGPLTPNERETANKRAARKAEADRRSSTRPVADADAAAAEQARLDTFNRSG